MTPQRQLQSFRARVDRHWRLLVHATADGGLRAWNIEDSGHRMSYRRAKRLVTRGSTLVIDVVNPAKRGDQIVKVMKVKIS